MKRLLFGLIVLTVVSGSSFAEHLSGIGPVPRPFYLPRPPIWGYNPFPYGGFNPELSLYYWHQHEERERRNQLLQLELIFLMIQSNYNSHYFY